MHLVCIEKLPERYLYANHTYAPFNAYPGSCEGRPFIVLEFCGRGSLRSILQKTHQRALGQAAAGPGTQETSPTAFADTPHSTGPRLSSGAGTSPAVLARTLLPWARRLAIAADAARGMRFLHTLNPVRLHRDLKARKPVLWLLYLPDQPDMSLAIVMSILS